MTINPTMLSDVMDSIVSICGYSGYNDMSGILQAAVTEIDKEQLDGKSCRNILDELTRVCASFAMIQGDTGTSDMRGILVFIPMNTGAASVFKADSGKYSKIRLGGIKRINAVRLYGSD
ncbi:MAG: hypothetical protein J6C52_12755, partial [Clostridia bacterium]|nr:hypothetical protein [Clostridia bacterium]